MSADNATQKQEEQELLRRTSSLSLNDEAASSPYATPSSSIAGVSGSAYETETGSQMQDTCTPRSSSPTKASNDGNRYAARLEQSVLPVQGSSPSDTPSLGELSPQADGFLQEAMSSMLAIGQNRLTDGGRAYSSTSHEARQDIVPSPAGLLTQQQEHHLLNDNDGPAVQQQSRAASDIWGTALISGSNSSSRQSGTTTAVKDEGHARLSSSRASSTLYNESPPRLEEGGTWSTSRFQTSPPVVEEQERERGPGQHHHPSTSLKATSSSPGPTVSNATSQRLTPAPSMLSQDEATMHTQSIRPISTWQRHSRQPSSNLQLSPSLPLLFQPDLPLNMLIYNSRFALLMYTIYPVLYFAQIPVTLFLDFNILYALIQIALHPTPNGISATLNGVIETQPRVNPWWIAVGFYALSTFVALIVVFGIHDLHYSYYKRWKNRNPPIMSIYQSAPAFNISSIRSYPIFCFLWRLRLSAFTGLASVPASRQQGVIEMSHHFMQNWPTITTLVPRAFMSLLLLVSFTANASSSDTSSRTYERDAAFFHPNGTSSTYSVVVNLINLTWAVWRITLALIAAFVYFFFHKKVTNPAESPVRAATPGDAYTVISNGWPSEVHFDTDEQIWKRNLRERALEMVLLCSSSNRWRESREQKSTYGTKMERVTRYPVTRTRQKRRSTVTFQPDFIVEPEMAERSGSAQSFSVHLPRDTVSSSFVGADGEGSLREPRVSSIPTRRKKTISNASVASSAFSGHAGTSDSQHIVLERPFSALGNHNEQDDRRLVRIPGESGAIPQSAMALQDDVEDEEEQERLEWERHPPVTPRGSLIQAREELAQQRKELSYWDSFGYANSALDNPGFEPTIGMLEQGRDLHAIFEESDEEASLRRTNSLNNRKSVSSRQSSLRRPQTPMSKLDDAAIHCIEERSEHI